MSDYTLSVTLFDLVVDASIDRLIRSSDPYLRNLLQQEVGRHTHSPVKTFRWALTDSRVNTLVHLYGEQYVENPCTEIDRYFDILNRRLFSRPIPTQMAVLYLFGPGKEYSANISALSAFGEAVAGHCMEEFTYVPLVRPLGIMPDIVLRTSRAGQARFALVESKASVAKKGGAKTLLEGQVHEFLVNIKTRAGGFGLSYEGYLVCSHFRDNRVIDCAILRIDLGYYTAGTSPIATTQMNVFQPVPSYDDPIARLRSIITLQADLGAPADDYMTGLLSTEASQSATLALLKNDKGVAGVNQVFNYIEDTARELGLADQWHRSQERLAITKPAEAARIQEALARHNRPQVRVEE
jgi:hypothetical protein